MTTSKVLKQIKSWQKENVPNSKNKYIYGIFIRTPSAVITSATALARKKVETNGF